LLSVLVAVAVGYFAWSKRLVEKCSGRGALGYAEVRVEQVSRGTMPYTLKARGELQSAKWTNVVAKISGIVKEVRYKVGDSVSQGAIVAIIEPKELLARAADVQANLTVARSQLAEKERLLVDAEKQLEEVEGFVKQDLVAKQELDRARFAADTARAQVDLGRAQMAQQEAMLAQSKKILGLSRLTAPLTGIVTGGMVEPGSEISDGSAILTITSLDFLRVRITVPERDVNVVSEGMAAEVHIDQSSREIFEGKVARLIPAPEPSGEIVAEVQLANPNHRLEPGPTVAVLIRADDEVFFAPTSAVLKAGKNDYVYTVVNGRAEPKEVLKAGEKDGKAAIKSGLSEGEWVVISGQEHIKPGDPVSVLGSNRDSCPEELG
jgi:RND family efflux transporter MFP subunit